MSSDKWMAWMMERHGTDEAGVRRIMAERGKKGPQIRDQKLKPGQKHNGGFSDTELARKAGELGRAKRFGKSEKE